MENKTRSLKRVWIFIVILLALAGLVLGIDWLMRRQAALNPAIVGGEFRATLGPGDIPVYLNGELVAALSAGGMEPLPTASFVDAEEGKPQEGWMLADALGLVLAEPERLSPETRIVVSSSSRGKSIELTWKEVSEPTNMVMFDVAGRGTLKLVSKLPQLDVRDEWVQDVDKIEIFTQ